MPWSVSRRTPGLRSWLVINLANNDAATSVSSGQYIKQVVPLRPRVITFGMSYNF